MNQIVFFQCHKDNLFDWGVFKSAPSMGKAYGKVMTGGKQAAG
jgi:hypothetical protein